MKKKIFKVLCLAAVLFSALAVWYLVDKLFNQAYLSSWPWLIFFVAVFFITWLIGAIVLRDGKLFLGITMLALLSQLIFTKSFESLGIIFVAQAVLWIARKFIRKEIKMRLKLDIWNYLRVGRRFFILAIALMLAGQYYFTSNTQMVSENFPKFKINHNQSGLLLKIIAWVDPNLIKPDGQAVNVNEFIINKFNQDPLTSKKMGMVVDFNNVNYNQQAVILAEGKSNISRMVEREVGEEEKMVDIFLEITNNKLDDFMSVNIGYVDKDMPITHLIFTVAIFLAIMGTGMLVSVFLVIFIVGLFRFLIIIGLLSINKKAVNMEVIKIV
ncbi:MAG: hypothetical protein WAV16_02880 [Candidatus Moraniibacteriota bacterium]